MPKPGEVTSESQETLSKELGPLVLDLRSRRKPVEYNWLLYHAAWRGKHTRAFFKSEMFSHYIPAARRTIEKITKRTAKMLVPTAEFFEVYPGGDDTNDAASKDASAVRAALGWLLTKRVLIYPLVRELARCYYCYGRAITKTGVEIVDAKYQGESIKQVYPTWRAVDPFLFYVWPENVVGIEKAQILVEDHFMPWDQYEGHVKKGLASAITQRDLTVPEWPSHQTIRLQTSGLSEPTSITGGQSTGTQTAGTEADERPLVDMVHISEVWKRRDGHWEKVWLVWNVREDQGNQLPRVVHYNPRPWPRPPYRMAVDRTIPGEHYTSGMMDDLEPLQVLLNDQVNMTLEGQATSFAPPVAVNPDFVRRSSSLVFRPRAKWLVDPDQVKWLEVKDTTKAGLMGFQFTLGMMDQFSGSNSLQDGMPTRNMPRAGFAVSSLLNLSMADLEDAARVIEDTIMTPSLADIHRLFVEFVPRDQILRIPGTQHFGESRQLTAGDLFGSWAFQWVGSQQSQDYQVKADRILKLILAIAKLGPQITDDLLARGKRINWEVLLKKLWRGGLQEMGVEQIIEDLDQKTLQTIMQQRKDAAVRPPRTSISLKGDLDPFTAKDLADDGRVNSAPSPSPFASFAGPGG